MAVWAVAINVQWIFIHKIANDTTSLWMVYMLFSAFRAMVAMVWMDLSKPSSYLNGK